MVVDRDQQGTHRRTGTGARRRTPRGGLVALAVAAGILVVGAASTLGGGGPDPADGPRLPGPVSDADRAWAEARGTIRIATGPSAEPAYMPGPDGEMTDGHLIENARLAADRIGVEVDFVAYPDVAQAVASVVDGTSDLVIAAERPDIVAAGMGRTTPFDWSPLVFVTTDPSITEPGDLAGRRVSTVPGSPLETALLETRPDAVYVEADSIPDSFELLLGGDVDAYLGTIDFIAYLLQEDFARTRVIGEPVTVITAGLYGPHDGPALRLLQAGRETISDNELRAAHLRWAGVDLTDQSARSGGVPAAGVWGAGLVVAALAAALVRGWVRRRRLHDLVTTDALTGLVNRAGLATAAARLRATEPTTHAACFVDLDGFKAVNDHLGHAAGDAVLRTVAERLRASVREGDVVARTGGDEFVVLVTDLPRSTARDLARRVAQDLVTACEEVVEVPGRITRVTASVGVAIADPGESCDALVARADLAMYVAKGRGKRRVVLHHPGIEARPDAPPSLESRLPAMLDAGALHVEFQPIVDPSTGAVVGAEALARLLTDDGVVGPTAFVPVAERTGQIDHVFRIVLDAACVAAAGWGRDEWVAVNLSPHQLVDPDLDLTVHEVLARTGLPAHRLVLELTDGPTPTGPGIAALHRLHDAGVRIAVGATARHLRAEATAVEGRDVVDGDRQALTPSGIPASVVKVDQRTLAALGDDEVHAVLDLLGLLAVRSGLTLVLQGVEHEADALRLAGTGALHQGWWWGRPLASLPERSSPATRRV